MQRQGATVRRRWMCLKMRYAIMSQSCLCTTVHFKTWTATAPSEGHRFPQIWYEKSNYCCAGGCLWQSKGETDYPIILVNYYLKNDKCVSRREVPSLVLSSKLLNSIYKLIDKQCNFGPCCKCNNCCSKWFSASWTCFKFRSISRVISRNHLRGTVVRHSKHH